MTQASSLQLLMRTPAPLLIGEYMGFKPDEADKAWDIFETIFSATPFLRPAPGDIPPLPHASLCYSTPLQRELFYRIFTTQLVGIVPAILAHNVDVAPHVPHLPLPDLEPDLELTPLQTPLGTCTLSMTDIAEDPLVAIQRWQHTFFRVMIDRLERNFDYLSSMEEWGLNPLEGMKRCVFLLKTLCEIPRLVELQHIYFRSLGMKKNGFHRSITVVYEREFPMLRELMKTILESPEYSRMTEASFSRPTPESYVTIAFDEVNPLSPFRYPKFSLIITEKLSGWTYTLSLSPDLYSISCNGQPPVANSEDHGAPLGVLFTHLLKEICEDLGVPQLNVSFCEKPECACAKLKPLLITPNDSPSTSYLPRTLFSTLTPSLLRFPEAMTDTFAAYSETVSPSPPEPYRRIVRPPNQKMVQLLPLYHAPKPPPPMPQLISKKLKVTTLTLAPLGHVARPVGLQSTAAPKPAPTKPTPTLRVTNIKLNPLFEHRFVVAKS